MPKSSWLAQSELHGFFVQFCFGIFLSYCFGGGCFDFLGFFCCFYWFLVFIFVLERNKKREVRWVVKWEDLRKGKNMIKIFNSFYIKI